MTLNNLDEPLSVEEPLSHEGYRFMGAVFHVYKTLGSGFLEEVYHEALVLELGRRDIPFASKVGLRIRFGDRYLEKRYIADLVVWNEIIVELKAVKQLCPEHEAQLLNYMKATGSRVGYLLNFGTHPQMEWNRFIL